MSRIFYDHLVKFNKLEKKINKIISSHEEKLEYWMIVDDIIHHRIMGCILDSLSREYHDEFISIYHKCPYDHTIFEFLDLKTEKNTKQIIEEELNKIESEIENILQGF